MTGGFGKYCLIKVVYLHSIEWTAPIEYIQNDDEISQIDIIQSTSLPPPTPTPHTCYDYRSLCSKIPSCHIPLFYILISSVQ